MKLSDQQWEFTQDVNLLLKYILDRQMKITWGEAWRPDFVQYIYWWFGKSKLKKGRHGERLAIDLIFFFDGKPLDNKFENVEKIKHVGKFWESLNALNRAGMFWDIGGKPDIYHFERKREK